MEKLFAERLKKCLDYRGKKAIDVAVGCGFSRGMMSNYLQGKRKPKLNRICEIADYLDISPAYLMGFTNQIVVPVIQPLNVLDRNNPNAVSQEEMIIDEITANLTWLDLETLKNLNAMIKTLSKDKKPL